MINIKDFCDMEQFEQIMSNWAKATGLATVAVGADGRYISECYNFTEFCIDLTRKSPEGCRRCEKCDREGKGVYFCHAGLIDFGIELKIGDEVVGSVIGGQALSEAPDDEKFRAVAREIGVNEDRYIAALHKVTIRSEEAIRASAELLGQVLNSYINAQYMEKHNKQIIGKLGTGAKDAEELVNRIKEKTVQLNTIHGKQKILALNASIEAARAGENGRGFAVVAGVVALLLGAVPSVVVGSSVPPPAHPTRASARSPERNSVRLFFIGFIGSPISTYGEQTASPLPDV